MFSYWLYRELRKYKSVRDAHNIAKRLADRELALMAIKKQITAEDWAHIMKTARADYSHN